MTIAQQPQPAPALPLKWARLFGLHMPPAAHAEAPKPSPSHVLGPGYTAAERAERVRIRREQIVDCLLRHSEMRTDAICAALNLAKHVARDDLRALALDGKITSREIGKKKMLLWRAA